MVAQSWEIPEHWYQTNVVALARLVKELEALPTLERYVHVTTPEVYGSTTDWVSENQGFAPSTPYAISRAAGDWHLLAMHKARHFPVVFTRAANVYGPGQRLYRIVPKATLYARLGKKLPLDGGGVSRRSFVHVDDVAAATLLIAQRGAVGSTYHISTDELLSIRDLVAKVFEIAGVADPARQVAEVDERLGKDLGYFLDSTRLRNDLGWKPRVDLKNGIKGVVSWVDANIDRLKDVQSEYVHKP
jgi:dTDP-glucose 4,6-dehydratase